MTAAIERVAPNEYLQSLGVATYQRAYDAGMSLSALLDREVAAQSDNDPLDGFERLLRAAGIQVRSLPEAGVYADPFEKFMKNESTRALGLEWIARTWRRAVTGRVHNNRAVYTSNDAASNTVSNQVAYAAQARTNQQIAPAIPLAELVAITTAIDGDTYKAYYITNDTASFRKVRLRRDEHKRAIFTLNMMAPVNETRISSTRRLVTKRPHNKAKPTFKRYSFRRFSKRAGVSRGVGLQRLMGNTARPLKSSRNALALIFKSFRKVISYNFGSTERHQVISVQAIMRAVSFEA